MEFKDATKLNQAAFARACKQVQLIPAHMLCPIAFAAEPTQPGAQIEGHSIEVRQVTIDCHTGDSFFCSKEHLIGRYAIKEIRKGEQIHVDSLEPAESFFGRLLNEAEEKLGPCSMEVARILALFADSYWNTPRLKWPVDVNKYEQAEALQRRVLAIHEELCGPYSDYVLKDCQNLVLLCFRQTNLSETDFRQKNASKWKHFLDRILEICRHTGTNEAEALSRIASYFAEEEIAESQEEYLVKSLAAYERQICQQIERLSTIFQTLADCYSIQGKKEDAELMQRRLVALSGTTFGENNTEFADALEKFASFLQAENRLSEVEEALSRAKGIRDKFSQGSNSEY